MSDQERYVLNTTYVQTTQDSVRILWDTMRVVYHQNLSGVLLNYITVLTGFHRLYTFPLHPSKYKCTMKWENKAFTVYEMKYIF